MHGGLLWWHRSGTRAWARVGKPARDDESADRVRGGDRLERPPPSGERLLPAGTRAEAFAWCLVSTVGFEPMAGASFV